MKIERQKMLGVMMTDEEKEALKKLALQNGMTMSTYIRMVIRNIIEDEKKKEENK